jgi:putative copper export protein
MLSPSLASVRLFLHVLAASVWVGGQITLAGLVPAVRRSYPQATKLIAQTFARVAWPAFGVAVLTGIWNLMAENITSHSSAWQATILLKIAVAIASGVFAAIHTVGKTKLALALGGALGALTAVAAMYLGILLNTAH